MRLPADFALGASRSGDAAGFVLAGGVSSRMGQDKALVRLAGRPLIEHSLAILRAAGLSASIAGARSAINHFASAVEDAASGRGPLSGVCAALGDSPASWAVFVTVDQPFLPAPILTFLLNHARITGSVVTLASAAGFPQTFPAIVGREALPILAAELDSGRSGCFSAFHAAAAALRRPLTAVPAEFLAQSGHVRHPVGLPPAFWFLNVNTPADLARAEAILSRRIA